MVPEALVDTIPHLLEAVYIMPANQARVGVLHEVPTIKLWRVKEPDAQSVQERHAEGLRSAGQHVAKWATKNPKVS